MQLDEDEKEGRCRGGGPRREATTTLYRRMGLRCCLGDVFKMDGRLG